MVQQGGVATPFGVRAEILNHLNWRARAMDHVDRTFMVGMLPKMFIQLSWKLRDVWGALHDEMLLNNGLCFDFVVDSKDTSFSPKGWIWTLSFSTKQHPNAGENSGRRTVGRQSMAKEEVGVCCCMAWYGCRRNKHT